MEFKLRIEDVENYEVGDFVVCDDNVYMIVSDSDDYVVLVDLICKYVSSQDYESISELLKDQFKNKPYRIIKNSNVKFVEIG